MFFVPQEPLYKRLFHKLRSHRTHSRLLLPWVILTIALAFFVLFTHSVVERYRLNHDNIIDFVPDSALLYMHIPSLDHHSVSRALRQFVSFHPTARDMWAGEVVGDVMALWPDSSGLEFQEAGFVLLSEGEPALIIFSADERLLDKMSEWEAAGFSVYREDSIVVVSSRPYDDWKPDAGVSLGSFLAQERVPRTNRWYMYADVASAEYVTMRSEHSLFGPLFESLTGDQSWIVAGMSVRDDVLIISEHQAPLAPPEIKPDPQWIDAIALDQSLLIKNISVSDILFSDAERFFGENVPIVTLLQRINNSLFERSSTWLSADDTRFSMALAFKEISETDQAAHVLVASISKNDQFDQAAWQESLRVVASYQYPQAVSQQLVDGSYITEFVAEVHDGIEIRPSERIGEYQIYEVVADGAVWDWVYAESDTSVYISNQVSGLKRVLQSSIPTETRHPCLGVTENYIAYDAPVSVAEQSGIDTVVAMLVNDDLVVCVQ